MSSKSDKLKKKMAMIAREREEYDRKKIAMQEDIDYMGKKDTDKDKDRGDKDKEKDKEKDETASTTVKSTTTVNDGENEPPLIRQVSKGRRADDFIPNISRKHAATTDDSDSASTSSSSAKRGMGKGAKYRRNSIHTSGGNGNHSSKLPAIGRCVSSSDMSCASDISPRLRPHPIPSGKKISDWCYTSPPDSTPPVIKGQQDLYVDIRFLGRGAFGTVDLVKNKEDNKLYAVKTMLVRTKDDQQVFLHEVKYLRNRHPFIIHLHDVFIMTNPKKVYLVMHYCEGGDLGNAISLAVKGKYNIPEGQIYKWFCQISLAVDFLHDLRLVHRDIKPQNILLSDSGEVAQLADFGLATELAPTKDSFESCEVGTPYFTAPEMINAEPCSFPVDTWSLGVVLFELLALELPFDGDDTVSLVKCILTENYRVELIPKGMYSTELLCVVEGLLCKDPAQRMTTQKILTSPGVAVKAASLPAVYRPKYLEERLKRAHVKQMTRQLELLGIHPSTAANSAAPSAASTPKRGLSPKNSFNSFHLHSPLRDVQQRSPTTSVVSPLHSPQPSPRGDCPVVQLNSPPTHLKTPVMKQPRGTTSSPDSSSKPSTPSPSQSQLHSPVTILKSPDISTTLLVKSNDAGDSAGGGGAGDGGGGSKSQLRGDVTDKQNHVATLSSPTTTSTSNSAPPTSASISASTTSASSSSSSVDVLATASSSTATASANRSDSSNSSTKDCNTNSAAVVFGNDNAIANIESDQVREDSTTVDTAVDTKNKIVDIKHKTVAFSPSTVMDTDTLTSTSTSNGIGIVKASGGGGDDEGNINTGGSGDKVNNDSTVIHIADSNHSQEILVQHNNNKNTDDNKSSDNNNNQNNTDNKTETPVNIPINKNDTDADAAHIIKQEENKEDVTLTLPSILTPRETERRREREGAEEGKIEKDNAAQPSKPHTDAVNTLQQTSDHSNNHANAKAVVSLPHLPVTSVVVSDSATHTPLTSSSESTRWQQLQQQQQQSPHANANMKGHGRVKQRRHSLHHPLEAARRMLSPKKSAKELEGQGQGHQKAPQGHHIRSLRRRCKSGTARVVEVVFLKEREHDQGGQEEGKEKTNRDHVAGGHGHSHAVLRRRNSSANKLLHAGESHNNSPKQHHHLDVAAMPPFR